MERSFGRSFGDVKAHRGEVAKAAAFSLGAHAYALDDHIVFADDDPSKEVVAHELTHVVQQRGGRAPAAAQAKSAVSASGDAHELEADRVASKVARNEPSGSISEAPRAEVSRLDAWDILNIGTGGAGGEREVTQNSPGIKIFNDLTSSMVLAVEYMPAEFKALFPAKDDIAGWWNFIQVAETLLAAQIGVSILAVAPETFATKLAALILEALIITFLVVMAVQLGVDAVKTASAWWDGVKAGEVKEAAKHFAHLVANLIQIIGAVADMTKVVTPHAPGAPHEAPKRPIGSFEEPVPAGKAQKAIEHAHPTEHDVTPAATEQVPEPEHATKGKPPATDKRQNHPGPPKSEKELEATHKPPKSEELHTHKPDRAEHEPGKKNEPRSCFVAGTLVWTSTGHQAIEQLEVGQEVWSRDVNTGERTLQRLIDTFSRSVPELIDIDVGGVTISCSPEHPFWIPQLGWRKAGSLEPGVPLTGRDNDLMIQQVRRRRGDFEVFNLEIEGLRNYHVSPVEILVHNKGMANRWFAARKEVVGLLNADADTASTLAQLVADGRGAGSAEHNPLLKQRGDLFDRATALKERSEAAAEKTKGLADVDENGLAMQEQQQANISRDLGKLRSDIESAKKPFQQRMAELTKSLDDVEIRRSELQSKIEKSRDSAQKVSEDKALSEAERKDVAKKVTRLQANIKRLFALKERLANYKKLASKAEENPTTDSGLDFYKHEIDKIEIELAEIEQEQSLGHMLGEKGTRMSSETMWLGDDGHERIDVENPAPGKRPGQIHYQPNPKEKWYYDPSKEIFYDENNRSRPVPRAVQEKLKDPEFREGLKKALRFLGETSDS